MNLANAYKSQRHAGWSRIEMLLALYDGALHRIESMLHDAHTVTDTQMRTVRILMELRAGLDFRYGDLPNRLDQLLEFAQHAVLQATPEQLQAARDVLSTLREGFEAIREDAIRLESAQVIPSTDVEPHFHRDV